MTHFLLSKRVLPIALLFQIAVLTCYHHEDHKIEFYVRADVALHLCEPWKSILDLQRVLREQKDRAIVERDEDFCCELVDCVDDRWIIVITGTGRMVLVRLSDGNIHQHSLEKAYNREALLREDLQVDGYIPLSTAKKVVDMTPVDYESFELVVREFVFCL